MGSKSRPTAEDLSKARRSVARPPLLEGFAGGLKAAVPIMLGYLPTAAAFGLVAREGGLGVTDAVLVSTVIFAGASQFALVGLLAAGSALPVAAATLLFLNARHLLYGASLAPRLRQFGPLRAALGAFGLTDEVFAVCSARPNQKPIGFGWLLGLEGGAYASWVSGTWAGAMVDAVVRNALPSLQPALSFALPALFFALLVLLLTGPVGGPSRSQTAVAAAAAAVTAAVFHLTGWGAWSVLAAGVVGPLVAVVVSNTLRRSGSG